MNVTSFAATLPTKSRQIPGEKIESLIKFAQGVSAAGDTGKVIYEDHWQPCDVAVMLGWVHQHGKKAPHLTLRQQILDKQKQSNKRTVIADSNLFLYRDQNNPHHILRYSFDGVFPNTGEYCNNKPDPARWNYIKKLYNLDLKNYRTIGSHILICLQRNGGWSMSGFNVIDWALMTIKQLRQYTDRCFRIRPHPGDKNSRNQMLAIAQAAKNENISNIEFSRNQSLIDDLQNCWALVNHNSSPAVGAVIEGIPIFITDPERSQAKDVANLSLNNIEKPEMFDRQHWIERISQCHWSHEDLTSGRCWRHMRKWCQ